MKYRKTIIIGLILTTLFLVIYPKKGEAFFFDLYDLSTNKVEYYAYETIEIHSNWTYYFSEEEAGFVQIQIFNESGMILWVSQEYSNRSAYMDINLNVSLSDLDYRFDKPQDFLDLKLYVFNDDGERIISTYQESVQVTIFTSGVFNFSMQIDKESYQYFDALNLDSSWHLLYNSIYETANLSFQILDKDQNIKWISDFFNFIGADSCLLSINLSLLDLELNKSYNNFSIISIYKNYNNHSNENSTTILNQVFFQIFSKDDFKIDLFDLSTDKLEYYHYETIEIHANWTYYYSEDEIGFVQIQVLNETGMILWASQEYPNRSSYMDLNLNISLSYLNYTFEKPQDVLDVKLYLFNDDGEQMVSFYQEDIQVTIFKSGVYNFSMQLNKETYQYHNVCYINSSWHLLYNSNLETANVSFQLQDENQNIEWVSGYFYLSGADSVLLSINLSSLELELKKTYNNFSIVAIYSNHNKFSNENSITILSQFFFPIFGKNDYKIDLYDLSTDKIEYYHYETIEIHANWTYYYSEDEVGFVQIQMLNESGMILWSSQVYPNRSTYIELNLNISLSDLSYNFDIPEDFVEIRFFFFNYDGIFIVSMDNISEIINLRIYKSGIYNFSMQLDKDTFQYNDTCYLNSSWYLQYNPDYERANISFQILDRDQNLKWTSNLSSLLGTDSISICINFSLLDLGLNRVINNFTLKAYYAHYNKLIPENNSDVICELNFRIIVDILKDASLVLSNSSYYYTSKLDISTSWELKYLPESQDLFIQIIIMGESDNIIWESQRFNTTGLHIQNWQLSISELPLNFTKDSEVLKIYFNLYWQDLIKLETVSENIIKKNIQLVKSNLEWVIVFEVNDTDIIQMQIILSERETGYILKYVGIQLKIFHSSSLAFQNNYITDLDGLVIISFQKEKELFCGVNQIVIELQSELYNNTIFIYECFIDENTPLGTSSPLASIITNPLFYSILGVFSVLSLIIFFKIKKKKLASLTISEELLEN